MKILLLLIQTALAQPTPVPGTTQTIATNVGPSTLSTTTIRGSVTLVSPSSMTVNGAMKVTGALDLAAGSIETADLTTDAVIASKIRAGSVQTSKLDTDAVTASAIRAGSVETDKVNAAAINTNKLAPAAVTTEKLACSNAANCPAVFNGSNQYPAADGSLITNIPGTISGGTTNRVAKWASATTLTNSAIFDSGSLLTINSSQTVTGLAQFTNSTSSQTVFSGFSAYSPTVYTQSGLLQVGSLAHGSLRLDFNYDNNSVHIDNTENSAGARMYFGMRTSGIARYPITLAADVVTLASTTINGDLYFSGTAPTIACDAGSPSIQSYSTNNAGRFAGGAGSVNCTVTFTKTFDNAPSCWCNNETTTQAIRAAPTTTELVCHSAAIGTNTISYGCLGME